MTKDILVIDQTVDVYNHIKTALESETTKVYHVCDAQEGLRKMHKHQYCLVVLDVLLSENDGHEIIVEARNHSPMPLLILSESADTADKIKALQNGADDYLAKPYDNDECLARAQALLRRYTELNYAGHRQYAFVSYQEIVLSGMYRTLSIAGEEIKLTKKEYDILDYFLNHRNRVLTYEQIYNHAWNEEYVGDPTVIFNHVRRLRAKLGSSDLLESVRGIGYRVKPNQGDSNN